MKIVAVRTHALTLPPHTTFVRACVEGPMAARVVGRDVHDTVRLLRDVRGAVAGNTSAKAAIDVAVHDLLARLHEMPLVRWLGGTSMTVRTDVTLPVGSTDALVNAAVARVADGFTVLKVKVAPIRVPMCRRRAADRRSRHRRSGPRHRARRYPGDGCRQATTAAAFY